MAASPDVVLINQTYSGISDSVIDQWYLEIVHPPMGLAFIAGYLRQKGVSVDIIDANADHLTATQIADRVREMQPKLIGINSTTPAMFDCVEICRAVREVAPDATLVIGGNHATTFPELTLKEAKVIDAAILFEGEETMLELAQLSQNGRAKDLSGVKGIAYLDERGEMVRTEPRPAIADLDSLGIPARDLLPVHKYRENFYRGHGLQNFTNVFINRGCPYECTFCDAPVMHGRKVRARSVPVILDELEDIVHNHGVKHVFFFDDTFTIHRSRVLELCRGIKERGLDITWKTETRVDLVDPELLREMREAGCAALSFGVESGVDRVLKVIKKAHTVEDARRGIRMAKDAGMTVIVYVIVGFMGDDEDSVRETIEFARTCGADYALFSRMIPLPGTTLFDQMASEDRIKTELIGNWPLFQLYGSESVIRHPALSDEKINELLHHAYQRFYMRPGYVLKRLFNTRSLNELKTLMAGARIVFRTTRSHAAAARAAKNAPEGVVA